MKRWLIAMVAGGIGCAPAATVDEPTPAKKLAGGFKFTEGPVVLPDGDVLFSDIPANRIYRWKPDGGITVFREPSQQANGSTLDPQGRMVSCEHATHRVTRTEPDGTVTVLAAEFDGRPLNSPNDVIVRSDGTIWFTDPTYGMGGRKDGQGVRGVYRFDPASGRLTRVAADFDQPNGLCFSPDETKLYVADSGRPHAVRVFAVQSDGSLAGGETFASIEHGVPDGMRVDRAGKLYVTEERGVAVFQPDGRMEKLLPVPETPTNLAFSADGSRLFVTARSGFYEVAP